MANTLANVLIEAGRTIQTNGLRMLGRHVVTPQSFVTIGVDLPIVSNNADVDESAVLIGNVAVNVEAQIGKGAVIRGDANEVLIGGYAVVGDNVVITAQNKRTLTGLPPVATIGNYAKLGHNSVLQSCIVEDNAVIGEHSIVAEGAIVETGAVLEPNSVVPPGHRIPANQRWGGNPATFQGEVHDH